MAKNDMDLYHSRLTPDDLNDLIIKYKIPRDLHPRLPSEDFVMSELSNDAIDIYHRMFDFSGVQIPFSSFLLALIKYYRVHFSQFGPLGDWFSFAKRCAPSLICIDDNHSCTNHWKSGFFFIDRRAIPDAMVWRHPDAAIDDPRPAAGSFNMADVRRLGAHVIKLRDIPKGVLVLSGLSRVWKSRVFDPVLWGADGNDCPKAEASQKRKASTSGATSSHVAKRTSNDDDDDACVEILLVTPLCSTAAIPSLGNHGGSFTTPTAKGSNPRDYWGKGVMVDDVVTPSAGDGVTGNCEFTREETIVDQFPTPRQMVRVESLSDDQLAAKMSVLHCMMMSHGDSRSEGFMRRRMLYCVGLELQSKAKGKERKKKIKSLTKSVDNLHYEVARLLVYLNQATGLVRKILASDEFSRVQGDLLSLAASARFERWLSMHQTKDEFADVLKKMVNFMPGAQDRLAEASPLVAQTDYYFLNKISEHATEPLSVILQLEPEILVRSANVPASREAHASPSTKESTVTPASKSLELSANVNFIASVVAPKHNKEMVNAEVNGLGPKMTDDTATIKSGHAFVQGISVALNDVVELVEVGSGRVSSGTNDVVVALFVGEKGDGLDPSSATGEEAAANPFRV
ncbi:hypothetical protein Tco_0480955 [Tanacetum coccineum]